MNHLTKAHIAYYNNETVHLKEGAVEHTNNIQRLTPYVKADVSNHGGECNMPTQIRRSARQQAKYLNNKGLA